MDTQLFVACIALATFVGAVIGYVVRTCERDRLVSLEEPTETGVLPDEKFPWPQL